MKEKEEENKRIKKINKIYQIIFEIINNIFIIIRKFNHTKEEKMFYYIKLIKNN